MVFGPNVPFQEAFFIEFSNRLALPASEMKVPSGPIFDGSAIFWAKIGGKQAERNDLSPVLPIVFGGMVRPW